MKNIWFISDTHFLHANMLNFITAETGDRFRGRYFADQDDCDELMIENWNKHVKPGDHIWHLGDVFIGDKDKFETLWSRLNGKKRLIVGNHDDIKYLSGKSKSGVNFFEKVKVWQKMDDMILTHVPMEMANSYEGRHSTFNVHGHIHNNQSPTPRHYNMCVEHNDWSPVHYEDLKTFLNRRKAAL